MAAVPFRHGSHEGALILSIPLLTDSQSIVKSGLSQRVLVQLSYAMGAMKPFSQFVETYDSECSELIADDTTRIVNVEIGCRPGGIAMSSALREP